MHINKFFIFILLLINFLSLHSFEKLTKQDFAANKELFNLSPVLWAQGVQLIDLNISQYLKLKGIENSPILTKHIIDILNKKLADRKLQIFQIKYVADKNLVLIHCFKQFKMNLGYGPVPCQQYFYLLAINTNLKDAIQYIELKNLIDANTKEIEETEKKIKLASEKQFEEKIRKAIQNWHINQRI